MNLTTGSVSPQFHAFFYDEFSSVESMIVDESPPSFWNEFNIESHTLHIPRDRDSTAVLSDEWLSDSDLEKKSKSFVRSNEIRQNFNPSSSSNIISDYPTTPSKSDSIFVQPLEEQNITPLEDTSSNVQAISSDSKVSNV